MAVPLVDLKVQYKALEGEINSGIQKVLDHGQYIMGPEVKECEGQLAQFVGAKHALGCASGTDALMIAMVAIDIQPGDEVIVPAFSFFATAEIVVLMRATPVFVDIDPLTYNLDPKALEEAVTDKTKAIVPVALYGQAADMDEIHEVAKKHNLYVLEDAAQSFGATYKDRKSGNLGHISCTSFFPAKPLGCYGDGGAVFTDDDELAKKMILARNHGQDGRYNHVAIGFNGRMDSIQGAVLLAKLKRYPSEIEVRQKAADHYTNNLSQLKDRGVVCPHTVEGRSSVWAQYTLRVPNRDKVRESLKELGIPTAVHYPKTMADQPAMKNAGRRMSIAHSQQAANEVMSLPMYGDITLEIVDEVCGALKNVLENI